MDKAEPGPLSDGTNPTVSGAAIEPVLVLASQDRALVAFTDGQVDRAGGCAAPAG